jgi:hypothetical protein
MDQHSGVVDPVEGIASDMLASIYHQAGMATGGKLFRANSTGEPGADD